jgi:hypothetical protein
MDFLFRLLNFLPVFHVINGALQQRVDVVEVFVDLLRSVDLVFVLRLNVGAVFIFLLFTRLRHYHFKFGGNSGACATSWPLRGYSGINLIELLGQNL